MIYWTYNFFWLNFIYMATSQVKSGLRGWKCFYFNFLPNFRFPEREHIHENAPYIINLSALSRASRGGTNASYLNMCSVYAYVKQYRGSNHVSVMFILSGEQVLICIFFTQRLIKREYLISEGNSTLIITFHPFFTWNFSCYVLKGWYVFYVKQFASYRAKYASDPI